MATESSLPPPPPSGGGAAKYIVILLILLMGGGGIWFATRSKDEPAQAPTPPPKVAERTTSLSQDSLEIPEEEEEAEEDAGGAEEPTTAPAKRAARPARDPWTCEGDLAPAEIRKVIKSSYATIRACYERRLKNANMLQGSLNVQVKVGPAGDVQATRVRGSLRDAEVRACVQGQAKSWTFPAPSGGCVVFDAPYNFTPKN